MKCDFSSINPLNAELNPICHLLALLGSHHILHVSRIRVNPNPLINNNINWIHSVCCVCCVLSGRGLCDELITRPEESYRLWYVVVCDLETS